MTDDNMTEIKDPGRAPITKIPNEILHNIFSALQDDIGPVTLDRQAGLWVLERVCKHWEKVIDNAPLLWQNIAICIPEYNTPRPVERRPEQVATMLRRSQSLFLQMTFVCTSRNHISTLPTFIDTIGSDIARESHRFHKKLVLHVPRQLLDSMDSLMSPTALLRDLDLRCEMPLNLPSQIQGRIVRSFQKTQLHTIYIANIDSEDLLIDWSHATTLTTPQSSSDEFHVLQKASSLVHYTHFSMMSRLPPGAPFVHLDNVRTVEISGHPCVGTQLILPILESATFNVHHFCPLRHIAALFSRSHCMLRSLRLAGQFILGESLLTILQMIPCLEELTLEYLHYGSREIVNYGLSANEFMTQLTDSPEEWCLAPNLKVFRLDMSAADIVFDWNIMRALWQSRQKNQDPEESQWYTAKLDHFFVADRSHEMHGGELSRSLVWIDDYTCDLAAVNEFNDNMAWALFD